MNMILGVVLLITMLAILWKRVIFKSEEAAPISKPIIYLAGAIGILGLLMLGAGQYVAEFIEMAAAFVKDVVAGAKK